MTVYTNRSALISADQTYRYLLSRTWDDGPKVATFVMLNPSTADADTDDPTIRRCVSFAQREGCSTLIVVNLYAYRATQPAELWQAQDRQVDIVGPDNDRYIEAALTAATATGGPVIAAWGAHAKPHRVYAVKRMNGMRAAQALAFTKAGAPGHPLYIKGDAPLVPLHR